MKPLSGSKKQVDWAEEIRKNFLAQCPEDKLKLFRGARVAQQAEFWIQNRNRSIKTLISALQMLLGFMTVITRLKEKRDLARGEERDELNRKIDSAICEYNKIAESLIKPSSR